MTDFPEGKLLDMLARERSFRGFQSKAVKMPIAAYTMVQVHCLASSRSAPGQCK